MPTFTKDVAYPGKWRLRDGRELNLSKEQISALHKRMNEMRAAGLEIPLAWNHQDEAKPMSAAERKAANTKLTFGWLKESKLAPEGYARALIEVPVAEDAKRLPAVRFVSPRIETDFVDGTGRKWPGLSITHLAATARPVQSGQQPFQPVSMGFDLSLDGFDLADDDPGEGDDQALPADDDATKDDDKDKIPDKGNLESLLGKLLSVAKLALPSDTSPENFIERLMTALLTLEASQADDDDDDDDMYPGTEPPQDAQPPVSMSLDTPAAKRLAKFHIEGLKTRIAALKPKIGGKLVKELLERFGKEPVELSIDGEIKRTGIVTAVEAYEKLPDRAAAFGLGASLSLDDAEPVDLPAGMQGAPQTHEQAAPVVDDFMAMLPQGRMTVNGKK